MAKPVVRGDLGSFLSDTPRPKANTRPQFTRVTRTAQALAELQRQGGWMSSTELAAAMGWSVSQANDCVSALLSRGRVERELSVEDGRRKRGQRYRVVPQ